MLRVSNNILYQDVMYSQLIVTTHDCIGGSSSAVVQRSKMEVALEDSTGMIVYQ